MLKLTIDPSFFPTVNTFFERHFCSSIKTRLLTFPLTCRNNLYGCIFLKEINQTACVFPFYLIFWEKKMHSQKECWNRRFRGSTIFFAAQPWWTDLYNFFPYILHFGSGMFTIYLKMKRLKNLWISVSTIIRFSQNLWEKIRNCTQERYIIKMFAKRITV